MNKLIMIIGAAAVVAGANASSITIDSVTQRWPWNNKFDITYTVTDGQLLTADGTGDVYCKIVFNATIGGQTYEIDGVTNIGASANSGTHTVTWTPPSSLRAKDMSCTMTATLMSATAPSGDDYMVVDLDDGTVSFEGMLHSQDLSNARYNTGATYKTDKMVLRKVPRWAKKSTLPNAASLTSGGYPTGRGGLTPANSRKYWPTKQDFYAGVFMVTEAQYKKIFGQTSSSVIPVTYQLSGSHYIHYNALRASCKPGEEIPDATSDSGVSFFKRLKYKTGNRFAFDLPTLIMSEIAARAGETGAYCWPGSDMDSDYVVWKSSAMADVGSKKANNWGLYDVAGNGYEFCRDGGASLEDPVNATSAFTPSWDEANWASSGNKICVRGGGTGASDSYVNYLASSYSANIGTGTATGSYGFRVFVVMK